MDFESKRIIHCFTFLNHNKFMKIAYISNMLSIKSYCACLLGNCKCFFESFITHVHQAYFFKPSHPIRVSNIIVVHNHISIF